MSMGPSAPAKCRTFSSHALLTPAKPAILTGANPKQTTWIHLHFMGLPHSRMCVQSIIGLVQPKPCGEKPFSAGINNEMLAWQMMQRSAEC